MKTGSKRIIAASAGIVVVAVSAALAIGFITTSNKKRDADETISLIDGSSILRTPVVASINTPVPLFVNDPVSTNEVTTGPASCSPEDTVPTEITSGSQSETKESLPPATESAFPTAYVTVSPVSSTPAASTPVPSTPEPSPTPVTEFHDVHEGRNTGASNGDDGLAKTVDVGEGKSIEVIPITNKEEGLRVDYVAAERVISVETADYLKNQTVSNSFSHISNPYEIIGTNSAVSGLPFYYVPGFVADGRISAVKEDFGDEDGDGILAAVYEKCDAERARYWGLSDKERNLDILGAVYIDVDRCKSDRSILRTADSALKDIFRDKTEEHLGIKVTRIAEKKEAHTDYFFLAFPLLDGRYVINIGGGIVMLNRAPEESLDVFFYTGGGDLGFYGLCVYADGALIFETDRFKVNSITGYCTQYG